MMVPSRIARFLFAGGGTGGHLYPAIAIAERLMELLKDKVQVEIRFVGTKRGLEYRIKDSLGYPLYLINVRGLARTFTLKNLLVPFLLIGSLIKSYGLIKKFSPDIVVGTGGYVALPVLKAAAMNNVTTVLQEQNSFPGITTRKSAPHASRIYLGFEKAAEYLQTKGEIKVTGNPVRRTINQGDRAKAARRYNLDPEKKTILVMGGSQGARVINQAVTKNVKEGRPSDEFQLLWQTGKMDYKDVTASVGEKAGRAIFPFATDMASVYALADVVIARAGAISLAELEACALPSILIPYLLAAGDHQTKNAEDFSARGYAKVIHEKDLDDTDLLNEAETIISSGQLAAMKATMQRDIAGRKPAVDVIAEDIIKLLTDTESREASID
jgi:UDP-N-acetylglucosamine--N-acetylmuramyl-(pentapeptide) pyrophosphoryl-undecaprenol N-acetylglucosamine transferase